MKDYYEILGLKKGATDKEIGTAFKKMAVKWHPDKWVNATNEEKKAAEEKFKEINEAHDVLSDPEKRKNYDMFGDPNAHPGGQDFNDPFHGFNPFGGFNPFAEDFGHKGPEKGSDIIAHVNISFAESYTGIPNLNITVQKSVPCPDCDGTGSEDKHVHLCPHCNGTGRYVQTERRGNAVYQQITTCPYCGGTGQLPTNKCRYCNGTGTVIKNETIGIRVPSGAFDGAKMAVRGQGNAPKSGNGINGDLFVIFHVAPDDRFGRNGLDLITTLDLTLLEAWDGCEKQIELPSGSVKVTIPKGSKDGDTVESYGKGFMDPGGANRRGNLIVIIKYKVPDKLSDEQRKLLEEFYKFGN